MASASHTFNSPFQASFQRVAETAATYGFALVDEVHTLVDEPAYLPKQIHPRVKQLAVTGLIFFGTLISTLGKLGALHRTAMSLGQLSCKLLAAAMTSQLPNRSTSVRTVVAGQLLLPPDSSHTQA
jgi:hypothetical protein